MSDADVAELLEPTRRTDSVELKLSPKCPPSEAFQVATEVRAFWTQRGVNLAGEQQTKTRKALEFFSERLPAEGT